MGLRLREGSGERVADTGLRRREGRGYGAEEERG